MTPRQQLRQDDEEQGEKLLEVAAVARRLKKCVETVRSYIKKGKLRAVKTPSESPFGTRYLVPESAIAEFLRPARGR